jgi:hypothetical protein
MKKKLLSFSLLLMGIAMIANAQIPNAGFENWTAGDPDGWASSNVPAAGLINVFQTSDKHSGSSALRGEVVTFLTTLMAPIIQSGPGGTGFAISEKYQSLELYYKFTSVGGDMFGVNVALTLGGNPIAQGAVALSATVNDYAHLTVPLTYTTTDVPDAAVIQISIVGPNTGIDFHLGSTMFVDDLLFSLSTGTEDHSSAEPSVKCYPNPACDQINIPFSGKITGECTITVSDIYGKEIKKAIYQAQQSGNCIFQLSVSDLLSGIYFCTISASGRKFSGKFIVAH